MRILAVIPARLAATRFPNKPMAKILGIPMIGHCYLRTRFSNSVSDVYVATCDKDIYDYITGIGGKAVMTSTVHERATERSAEALLNIEKMTGEKFDIVVMVQGDEPLIDPDMLQEVISPMLTRDIKVSNLMSQLMTDEEKQDTNNVKVVFGLDGKALYMSREAIPSKQKYKEKIDTFRQLGLIAFTREALLDFISLAPTSLEIIESVDMNRLLQNDIPVHMVLTQYAADAVDTPADLVRVEAKMSKDNIFLKYKPEAGNEN